MTSTMLVPITHDDVPAAIASAAAVAAAAQARHATVLVLETDCLHGWLTEVEPGCEEMELQRIHGAAEWVAAALREHGASVEVALECVRRGRRPVDPETVRRHGADTVFLPHPHRWTSLVESATLRRLRREGVTVLEPGTNRTRASVAERLPARDD